MLSLLKINMTSTNSVNSHIFLDFYINVETEVINWINIWRGSKTIPLIGDFETLFCSKDSKKKLHRNIRESDYPC